MELQPNSNRALAFTIRCCLNWLHIFFFFIVEIGVIFGYYWIFTAIWKYIGILMYFLVKALSLYITWVSQLKQFGHLLTSFLSSFCLGAWLPLLCLLCLCPTLHSTFPQHEPGAFQPEGPCPLYFQLYPARYVSATYHFCS